MTQRILTLLITLAVGSAAAAAICGPVEWFLYSIIAACIAIIALGAVKAVQEPAQVSTDEVDAHWETLPPWMKPPTGECPPSTEVVHTPPVALTVIKGGKDPAWHEDHRPVWDHTIGAPE